jgi:hypothetical protein
VYAEGIANSCDERCTHLRQTGHPHIDRAIDKRLRKDVNVAPEEDARRIAKVTRTYWGDLAPQVLSMALEIAEEEAK